MKQIILSILFIQIWTCCLAQTISFDSIYQISMDLYSDKNYQQSAIQFDKIFAIKSISDPDFLYNASCVYALNNEPNKAIKHLKEITEKYFYADVDHLTTDTDLDNLHNLPDWKIILENANQNKITLPGRRRNKIRGELLKTKALLDADNGYLWGGTIWNDRILILDDQNVIYTLNNNLSNAQNDDKLYYKTVDDLTLLHTNTNQVFEGEKWAIVQNEDVTIADSCQTIIHELFHLFHLNQINLSGNIVEYLDDYRARILLRSEFEALRNCLKSIQLNDDSLAKEYLRDAIYFRAQREQIFEEFNHFALELETLEGLASYTGYKLSAHTDLYNLAIFELNGRERKGLNRSFAYATGLAYGLIFDYFKIKWRSELNHIYSFANIYNSQKRSLRPDKFDIEEIKKRNKYYEIEQQEIKIKESNDSIRAYYKNMLVDQPTLIVKRDTSDKTYLMSYDMNSTFTFGESGIIYSNISSSSVNPEVFGNFKTIGDTKIGKSGILITSNFDKLTFPKPLKIEGNIITGEYYEIELNKDWRVKALDNKGNLEIIKEE